MQKFNLSENLDRKRHVCQSYREGDLIIFICPDCDYIRQINFKTKKMESVGGAIDVIHEGMHQPIKMIDQN